MTTGDLNRLRMKPGDGKFILAFVLVVVAIIASGTIGAQTQQVGPPPTVQSKTFVRVCGGEDKSKLTECVASIDEDLNRWLIIYKETEFVSQHTSVSTTSDANDTVAGMNRTVYVVTIFYR